MDSGEGEDPSIVQKLPVRLESNGLGELIYVYNAILIYFNQLRLNEIFIFCLHSDST